MPSWSQSLLYANLAAHALLLMAMVWSIALPAKRLYPLERKGVRYALLWGLFGLVLGSNPVIVYLDWSTGPWTSPLRFWLGVPPVLIGAGLVSWGTVVLGGRGTSALPSALVVEGPYRLTRNPQYVGDFFIFAGMSAIANSGQVVVTHLLTVLVFLIAPLAEEPWLAKKYGKPYLSYQHKVPRFL